jgi:AcrR family transcriptional regulator
MSDTGTGLPPAIEQLWGLREPGRRGGPKPALSLDRIVAAAVALADESGLAGLSMARLAERLGFTTMSLYRYVASKDDLLLLVLDAAIGEPPPRRPDAGWRDQCAEWSRALVAMYVRHPWALELPVSVLPAGPNQLSWLDRALDALAETRLEEEEKLSSALLLAVYSRTQAQLAVDLARAVQQAEAGGPPALDWAGTMIRVADPVRFPAIARVIESGVFDDGAAGELGDYPEDEFDFGLQRVLDGLAALDRSRRPTPD